MTPPTLGQFVYVPTNPALNGGLEFGAAQVTRVHSETTINARVTYDAPGQEDHLTSLTYVDTLPGWDPEKNMRVWSWPPRV